MIKLYTDFCSDPFFKDDNKVDLIPAENKESKEIVKQIIKEHHSYVPTYSSVGRRIDWIIKYNIIVGMIGIGSSTYPPPKDLLTFLKISKNEYKKNFNNFANNWRFCLSCSEKNLGTKILKEFRKQAKIEWERKYKNKLKYIITFVGKDHNGAVYKADNWIEIGSTAGLPFHKSVSMKWDDNKSIAKKFVKPTGENKKLIFIYCYK